MTIKTPQFDAELVARYDKPGPRYTSYPTAPQFHDGFGQAELHAAIEQSNRRIPPRPLSLYIHIPFCTSPCFYCGCNRIITRDIGKADHYLQSLHREIEMMAPLFAHGRCLRQLHFGGGTPNFLDVPRMAKLMAWLRRHFNFESAQQCEIGIEIDPRFADSDYICALAEMGFNRISVGVQDFNPQVQKAVNRIQSVAQTREVLDAAKASGYRSTSIDLIYGLPKQTHDGFAQTLDRVIEIAPDRVAVYGYAHLPSLFKPQKQIRAQDLPEPMNRLHLLGLALDKLTAAGYVYIGMDHFARADDELVHAQQTGNLQRNFQGYSTHGDCDIIGLGVSAISRIDDSYSQNVRDLPDYYLAVNHDELAVMRGVWLTTDDLIRRDAITALMCQDRIDMVAFGQRHNIDFQLYFSAELAQLKSLAADGLLELNDSAVRVSPRGRFLLRNIAMCFDAYLPPQTKAPARYSQAI